jgi:branched-chain amino acid transport system permease protein
MTQLILFNVANGLIIGAFYALMAIGLSLIMSLSDVINFAHGGFLTVGAYLAYTLAPYVGFWGGLVLAPVLTAILGLIVEKFLISRVYGRDPLYSLLLTFGLAFMFEDGSRFIWGAQSVPYEVPSWLMQPLSQDYFFLTGYRLFMIALVAIAVGGLFWIMNKTRLGLRIRAGTLDLETVSVLGVNVRILRNRPARPGADDRCDRHHAELRRDHHRRPRQPAGHAVRRLADRPGFGNDGRLPAAGLRGGDLCDDGARPPDPPAGSAW